MKPLALVAGLLLLLAGPALAQAPGLAPASLAVKGVDGRAVTLTAADLAALPRAKVRYTAHGETHDYEGPLLIDILVKVGAPRGEALRGPALTQVVLVTASDGYKVTLTLAEADPATRSGQVILADRADGQPLDAKSGPYRLIVEGDLRPARSARMVISIQVIDLAKPAP